MKPDLTAAFTHAHRQSRFLLTKEALKVLRGELDGCDSAEEAYEVVEDRLTAIKHIYLSVLSQLDKLPNRNEPKV